nr:hypothetical protein [Tanacetum cinerariifolium]
MLGADEGGQGEGQAGLDPGAQSEGQTGSDASDQDEGQAGSNPDEIFEGQAGPDPRNTRADVHSILSPMVHAGSDCEQMDLDRIGELEHIMANLIQVNKEMEERLDKHRARLYTLEQLDIPKQVSKAISEVVTDAVDWAMQASLRNCFRDLPEADMKEILHQRMWETESYKSHEDHMQLFELKDLQHSFRDSDVRCYVQEKCGYGVLMSQPHKMAMLHNKDGQEMYYG